MDGLAERDVGEDSCASRRRPRPSAASGRPPRPAGRSPSGRRAPSRASAAASMAARSPDTTTWPGALRLATPNDAVGRRRARRAPGVAPSSRPRIAAIGAVASGAGRLHQPAALADEADAVLEREDLGGDEGGVLAHRVAGGECRSRGVRPRPLDPALADGGEIGDRGGEQRRLGVLGPVEELGRDRRTARRADGFAEGGVGRGEDGGRCRRGLRRARVPCRPTASPGRGRRRQASSSCPA